MRKFANWLEENNMVHDTLDLKKGIGILVKAEHEFDAVEYLKSNKISSEYNYICNNELILFKF